MWPLSLIPESIDPTMRKIIIFLVVTQVLAFLAYLILLIQDFKKNKRMAEQNAELQNSNLNDSTKVETEVNKNEVKTPENIENTKMSEDLKIETANLSKENSNISDKQSQGKKSKKKLD